jgi:hypothetical protein
MNPNHDVAANRTFELKAQRPFEEVAFELQ